VSKLKIEMQQPFCGGRSRECIFKLDLIYQIACLVADWDYCYLDISAGSRFGSLWYWL